MPLERCELDQITCLDLSEREISNESSNIFMHICSGWNSFNGVHTHTHTPWKPKKSSSPSAKICQRVRPVRLMFHTFDSWSGGECYFPSSCLRGQGPNCRCSCWFDTPRITGAPNLNTDPIGPSQRKEFLDARPVIRQSWTFVSLHKLFVAQLDFGWVRWVMLGENSCVKTGGSSTPEC